MRSRSLILVAPALIAALACGPARSATPYGAQYGGQEPSPVWEDVPPVQLQVPGRMPAAPDPIAPPPSGWHDHADRTDRRAEAAERPAWDEARDWRRDERGGAMQARGWGRRPGRGWTLPPYWMSPAYAVSNWGFYGLGRPDRGQHWVRYYDDAVLVDDRGVVVDTVDDLDWDRPASSYAGGYASSGGYGYGARYAGPEGGSGYAAPGYAMRAAPPAMVYAAPIVTTFAGPGYATTTIVQAPPVVTTTTTTTTYVDEVVATRRAVPRRVWHRPRRITCCCRCR